MHESSCFHTPSRPSNSIPRLYPIVALSILMVATAVTPLFGRTGDEIPSSLNPLTPATSGGAPAVDRALARLSGHRRLLMIAAHPDDEDTFVLAHVSALGGEAAYLSLSRGDGGQNLIGSELGAGLGLLRSRELQAARQVDGARQFFTRAFDFGYTRSLDETFERWPEDILMADARAVIRRFKPQVLVAVFPADARAGHGQHQVSAVVAEKLFAELSGDGHSADGADRRPWSIDSFYRASWWNPTAATVNLDLGRIDPFTGRSTFQTALASRSRHRCQDMGFEQPPGHATAGLIWQGGTRGPAGDDLFAGSDTRLSAIADPLLDTADGEALGKYVAEALSRVEDLAKGARASLVPARLGDSAPALAEMVRILGDLAQRTSVDAAGSSATDELRERLAVVHELIAEKLYIAREGLSAAAGIVVDAITDRETLVAGETLEVRSLFWHTGSAEIEDLTIDLLGSGGRLTARRAAEPQNGRFRVEVTDEQIHTVVIADHIEPTVPYFLRHARDGDLYSWQDVDPSSRGLPFADPPLRLRFRARIFDVDMVWIREVVHRYRDQAIGEIRRPLRVVPALEISLDRDLAVRSSSRRDPLILRAGLLRNQEQPLAGELIVDVPDGWPTPPAVPFELAGPRGQRLEIDIPVKVPPDIESGRYELSVSANGAPGRSLKRIEYEHIRPVTQPEIAELTIHVAAIALPELKRVAYLRGASDRVPEMLLDIGLPLELVSAEDLLTGELEPFDAIVIGSRAFEIEPLLAKANQRLLDFARRGGTVLVQYQQYQYVRGGFAPHPLDIKRPHDRVTDETASVRLLDPGHPFFHTPNAITDQDWQGWVQERGLYFGGDWDPAWTPLLAMSDPIGDPGGDEKHGALLVTELGEGRYIYTGLAFFRQLPAGVVGAYRLFLNLLQPPA